MKIREGFMLCEVAGETVAVPSVDGELNMNLIVNLNGTGKFLWEKLAVGAEEEELVVALLQEYDVDRTTAERSVRSFVAKLADAHFLG